MKKIGVFLARMQPLHFGHTYVIETACKENDEVVLILGSANKEGMLRNPFTIELREQLLKDAITNSIGKEYADKITIYEIPDWTHETDYDNQKEWGLYLYYNIVSRIETKNFSLYYSDEPEIMLNWFEDYLKSRINFRFLERAKICEGMSATKIRRAFEDGDVGYVKRFCPQSVVNKFTELKEILDSVRQNPKDDFS